MQTSSSNYPATFTFDPPEKVANWRALVSWILAIPHLIIATALRYVSQALALVGWFIIVFTGRLPEGFANFQAMYMRYYLRAMTYAAFMREEYPPFTFAMTPADPGDDRRVNVTVAPTLEDRNRVTVGFRIILVIPHLICLVALSIAAVVAVIIAFFAVLFTGRWPEGIRNFVLGVARWWLRVDVYFTLLTDEYPPFSLD